MKSGDRSEYRALPSQLKSLLTQLDPHDLSDFPNAHIVRVYLQPLEFLQLHRRFVPKFAFHSFLSADATTAQQSSSESSPSTALDIGAYVRSREALLRWLMPNTKALANYTERSFGWQQSKLENVLHRCCGACASGASAASWDAARCASGQTMRMRTATLLSRSSRSPRSLRTCPVAQAKTVSPRQRKALPCDRRLQYNNTNCFERRLCLLRHEFIIEEVQNSKQRH